MSKNRAVLFLPALLVLLALFLAGCKDFSFYGVLGDRFNEISLQIAPVTASAAASGGTITFTATGGAPPYGYSVVSGSGSIDAVSGTFTANAAGTDIVRVADSKGSTSDAAVTVTPSGASLQIAPPIVSVLVGGTVTFYVSGGTPPYTFSVLTNNSGAPPMTDEDYTAGLVGAVTDTVQVQDGAAATATASVTVVTAPVADVDYRVLSTNFLPASGIGGQAIPGTYNFTIQNNGTDPGVQPVSWWVFISADGTLGSGDALLASGSAGALPAGGSTVPPIDVAGTWPAVGGNRWLFVLAAAGDDLNSGNNASSGSAVTLTPPPIDYVVTTVGNTGPTAAGGSLTGSFQYRNNLTSAGTQSVHWIAYVSTDATLDVLVDPVIDSGDEAALPGSTTSAAVAFSGTWPAGAGNRYLFVAVSVDDDTNTANNTASSAAVAVTLPPVDYVVTAVGNTGPTVAGGPLAGNFQYRNNGSSAGSQNVHWIAYASTDAVLDAGDPLVDSGDEAALPGSTTSAAVVFSGTWPAGGGNRYLIVAVSAGDDVNTGNNTTSSAAVAVSAPPVDYLVTTVGNTGPTVAWGALAGSFQYRNNLTSAGTQSVHWIAYVSMDAVQDAGDPLVDSGDEAALPGSTTSAAVVFSGTWPAGAGNRYLIVAVSAGDDVNTGNNTTSSAAVAVSAPAVDYSGSLSGAAPTRAGGSFNASITIANGPAAAGSRAVFWNVYASLGNAVIDGGDKLVGSGSFPGLGPGGSSGALPISNSWPSVTGDYFLVADIQAEDDINTANNRPSSGPFAVGATDYSGVVAHSLGTTAGAAFTGTLTISNIGGAYALNGSQDLYWNVYASLGNMVIGTDDKVVGSGVIAGGLAAGGSSGALPIANTWPLAVGSYYLIADLFAGDDANSTNNRPVSGAVAVAAPPAANVDYSGVVVHLSGTTAGGAFTGTLTISNVGSDGGTQDVSWSVYASRGNTSIDGGDTLVASGTIVGGISAGNDSGALAIANTWPTSAGTYYLVADIQALDDVNPANDQPASSAVTVTPSAVLVDYSGSMSAGAPTRAGGAFTASLMITNGSAAAGSCTVYWNVYASLGDTTIDGGDKLVGSGSFPGLGAGGSSGALPISNSWPAATGSYYLVAQILADDEAAPANNTPASSAVAVGATDYSGVVAHSAGLMAGAAFTGTLTISNIGGAYALNGSQDLYWNVYASLDNTTIDAADKVVGSGLVPGGLAAGGSSGALPINNTWPLTAGNYYLIADLFAGDDANSTNNKPFSGAVTVAPAPVVDYTVTAANNTGALRAGNTLAGNFSLKNVGQANGTQTVYWSAYASYNNSFLDAGDAVVASGSRAQLNGGAEVTGIAFSGTWPGVTGACYLIVGVTAVDDSLETNNALASSQVTVLPPSVDYAASNVTVNPSGLPPEVKTDAIPGTPVSGNFQYSNSPLANAVSWVSWTVYASLDMALSGDDILVASGSAPPLALGQSGPIAFSGTWPLNYGIYYLIAKVDSSEESAPANNWASAAAMRRVGIYDETLTETLPLIVPDLGNGDYFLSAPCLLNVTFRPGLSVRINGIMDASDVDDIFAFNTGTANTITFYMTWASPPGRDVGYFPMIGPNNFLTGRVITNAAAITWAWTPDALAADRWWDVENSSTQNIGAYVLTIAAE
jgi:hypothetical protein